MIPNKSVFKFSELTPITGVKPYVLRFWETEFPEIGPVTSDTGDRLYGRKDVELILKIKKLLFEDKLSIPEAKLALKNAETISSVADSWKHVTVENFDQSNARFILKSALDLISQIKSARRW